MQSAGSAVPRPRSPSRLRSERGSRRLRTGWRRSSAYSSASRDGAHRARAVRGSAPREPGAACWWARQCSRARSAAVGSNGRPSRLARSCSPTRRSATDAAPGAGRRTRTVLRRGGARLWIERYSGADRGILAAAPAGAQAGAAVRQHPDAAGRRAGHRAVRRAGPRMRIGCAQCAVHAHSARAATSAMRAGRVGLLRAAGRRICPRFGCMGRAT